MFPMSPTSPSYQPSSNNTEGIEHPDIQLACHNIRSRFNSSGDLLHRLFVCISGTVGPHCLSLCQYCKKCAHFSPFRTPSLTTHFLFFTKKNKFDRPTTLKMSIELLVLFEVILVSVQKKKNITVFNLVFDYLFFYNKCTTHYVG